MQVMKTTSVLIFGLVGFVALSAWPAAAQDFEVDPRGYLYGTIETEKGTTYTGLLRWGREESFWGDHFNAGKDELPFRDARPKEQRDRKQFRIFGMRFSVGQDWDWGESRQFIARFGDIRSIERTGRRHVFVTMKDGTEYEIDDSSNDVGATITVDDVSLGKVKLDWDRMEMVTFSQAPADLRPDAWRLFGVVKTTGGDFKGFVQWDLHECLSTDELDGESDDGDLSIEMGRIAAIEKNNRRGAWVELQDGRRMLLEGTNDVDSSTSGIFVEDERYGRVKVQWGEFERVDFEKTGRTGPGYDAYPALGWIKGKVTDLDGKSWSGDLVYDLDESQGWELLNGSADDIEYNIPFAMVRSLEPTSRDRTVVTHKSGEELVLEDSTDVSDDNDGVVIVNGKSETYVAWRDVERIDLE